MQPLLNRKKVAPFFSDYRWNYLAKAILDGYHGEVRVDDVRQPHVAVLQLSPLPLFFLGGDFAHPAARHFIKTLPPRSLMIFARQTDAWEALCREVHGTKMVSSQRYAFTSENLDIEHLRPLRDNLPDGFTLKPIDLPLAAQITAGKSPLTEDHILTFDSVTDFMKKGFGFVILEGEKIVSIASTFVVCEDGIEIQINTDKKYEGRGLGT
ncbi:MAG TPA: GNAT family N-acetyltransferase, partial [Anaerolineales bacterium]|nr:GNAT family N-acetyltransferase [Anaerolineales bacterium]